MRFCFYLSPWDRHEKSYGTAEYNNFFINQLTELLTNYGNVGEVWFDGANGEGPNGKKQEYDWDRYYATVRKYQPEALIAVTGPDIRWIGNEDGLGSETEWCTQPKKYKLQIAGKNNLVWYPSECDVSIRPGWFYHSSEDQQLKSAEQLIDIYFKSVGRNSNLLLNIPPDQNGLISEFDRSRLKEWREKLDEIFAKDIFYEQEIFASNYRDNKKYFSAQSCLDGNRNTFWTTDTNVTEAELLINLNGRKQINIIKLEEAIEYGQRIKSFEIHFNENGVFKKICSGTTIGRSRIVAFNKISTDKIKIKITGSFAAPALRIIKGFYTDAVLQKF